MEKYEYPELPTPPPPATAILDMDSILFKAAMAGETTWYIAKEEDGREICRFNSALAYKNWLDNVEAGFDFEHFYQGDPDKITREVEYEVGDVKNCYRTFDNIIDEWLIHSGCEDWMGYVGKKTGARVFRYDIATIHPYKAGREGTRKPHYLEAVRKYANKNPNIKTVRNDVEVDDRVLELAEKMGHKACLTVIDKDGLQARGCWIMLIDQFDSPVFSSKRTVGTLWKEGGKVYGTSFLFHLFQLLKGDKQVDGIVGLPKWGDKKAYDLLEEFSGVHVKHLPDAILKVADQYKEHYGDSHSYKHCYSGEEVEASWRDIMHENVRLLWMKRHKDDIGEVIMKHVPPLV